MSSTNNLSLRGRGQSTSAQSSRRPRTANTFGVSNPQTTRRPSTSRTARQSRPIPETHPSAEVVDELYVKNLQDQIQFLELENTLLREKHSKKSKANTSRGTTTHVDQQDVQAEYIQDLEETIRRLERKLSRQQKDHTEEHQSLIKTIEKLELDLSIKHEEHLSLNVEVGEVEEKYSRKEDELNAVVRSLKEDIAQKDHDILILQDEINDIEAKLTQSLETQQTLCQKLSDLNSEKSAVFRKFTGEEQRNEHLQKRIDSLVDEVAHLESELQIKMEESVNEQLKSERDDLLTKIDEFKRSQIDAETVARSAELKRDQYEKMAVACQDQISMLSRSNSELSQQVSDLNRQVKNLNVSSENVSNQINDLKSKNLKLKENVTTLNRDLEVSRSRYSDLESETNSLSSDKTGLELEISRLNDRVTQQSNEIQGFLDKLKNSDMKQKEMKSMIASLQSDLDASQQTAKSEREQVKSLKLLLSKTRGELNLARKFKIIASELEAVKGILSVHKNLSEKVGTLIEEVENCADNSDYNDSDYSDS
ncbi:hypothetical protein GEMRC1_004407 [Eukaryota sp. GEM-RC1]